MQIIKLKYNILYKIYKRPDLKQTNGTLLGVYIQSNLPHLVCVCVCVELHVSYISYHGRFVHTLCKCHAGTLQSCYGDFICMFVTPRKTSHPWVLYPSRARLAKLFTSGCAFGPGLVNEQEADT